MCVIVLALFGCTDSDFFAIRKITHMSEEILSRIVENFIDVRNALERF